MSQPDFTAFLKHCQTLLSAGAVLPADRLPPYAASGSWIDQAIRVAVTASSSIAIARMFY
jgi:hypothetical protein